MLVDELLEESKDALAHYGIKGQKWGLRRFQNEDGTYTELGKERRRVGYTEPNNKEDEKSSKGKKSDTEEFPGEKIGGKAYKDMTKKELRAAKKRARHNEAERRERREFNRDKAQAIEDGNLSFISKNINKFTNDEIDVAIRRYNKMKELKDLEKSTQKPEGYYFDKAIRFLDRTAKASKSIADIANNINDVKTKNEIRKQAELNTKKLARPEPKKEESWDEKRKKYEFERQKKKDEEADEEAKLRKKKGLGKNLEEDKKKYEFERQKQKDKEADEEAKEKKAREAQKGIDDAQNAMKKAAEDAEDRARKVRKDEADAKKAEYDAEIKKAALEKVQKEKAKNAAEEAERLAREEKARKEAEEAEEKARKAREKYNEDYWEMYSNTMAMLPDFPYGNAKIGGLFLSKKDKKAYNKYWNEVKDNFKDNVLDLDNYNAKMLANNAKKLEEYYKYYFDTTQLGSMPKAVARDKKGEPKFTNTRDIRWYKESKQGEADKIDDWVKEMAEKYEKEHGYSKAVAKEKAEDYVDYWLDLYGKKKR